MTRFMLALFGVCIPLLCGCATERQALLNNRPLWGTIQFFGGFFDDSDATSSFEPTRCPADDRADIRPL